MAKLTNRWLRRWSDENGEICSVRHDGEYWIYHTIPAWEPRAGEVSRRKVSEDEARKFDFDPTGDFKCTENDQAKMEHDPFFE